MPLRAEDLSGSRRRASTRTSFHLPEKCRRRPQLSPTPCDETSLRGAVAAAELGQCRPQHLDRRARQPHWSTRGSDRRGTHDRPSHADAVGPLIRFALASLGCCSGPPRPRGQNITKGGQADDEPRSGKRRADAGGGGKGNPGGRRDHPYVDEAIRHPRDPVDRAKPAHLPGNALYLPWRRRVHQRCHHV